MDEVEYGTPIIKVKVADKHILRSRSGTNLRVGAKFTTASGMTDVWIVNPGSAGYLFDEELDVVEALLLFSLNISFDGKNAISRI